MLGFTAYPAHTISLGWICGKTHYIEKAIQEVFSKKQEELFTL